MPSISSRRFARRQAMLLMAALVGLGADQAAAQTAGRYPVKPITWIVGYAPGGSVDVTARLIAKKLEVSLGQPVVVENRPGASGAIALGATARAAADGYTIVTVAGPEVSAAAVPELGKELAGVATLGTGPMILVGTTATPMPATLKELLARAKESPDKYSFGSSGTGTSQHLAGELINQTAATKMTHVAYKGGGQAVVDLLGGQIPLAVLGIPPVLQHIKSGKLKAYGVTTASRSGALPEVPTLSESGIAGFDARQWYAVATTAGVPTDRIQILNAALNKALTDPEIVDGYTKLGVEPFISSSQETTNFVAAEKKRWTDLARTAKISLN